MHITEDQSVILSSNTAFFRKKIQNLPSARVNNGLTTSTSNLNVFEVIKQKPDFWKNKRLGGTYLIIHLQNNMPARILMGNIYISVYGFL